MSTYPSARLLPVGALLLLAVSLPCRALDLTGTPEEPNGKVFGLDPVLLSAIAAPETGWQPGSPEVDLPVAVFPDIVMYFGGVGAAVFDEAVGFDVAADPRREGGVFNPDA